MTYVDVKFLRDRYQNSVPTIWRWARERKNGFPAPIKLGPNCTRWRLADLEAWEATREMAQ
ncbi:helix-turn-helix transcriptional regulator [Billgrantia montanilacus]|uniref:AlpA family phage regulatory protein n=1 Tax=Billgrantia montanilacus TaxID=2282305 RepID=A0A368TSC7_9GAMM|nr:AlpA family phage regulatory protein [Halomonas montanilacus]RCV87501.1 AlpA family phage regulatory protein [Halomonas montanilacus]